MQIQKTERNSRWSLWRLFRAPGRPVRFVVAGAGAIVLAIAGYLAIPGLRASGEARTEDGALDAALTATVEQLMTNSACPATVEGLQEWTSAMFPMLHPELADRSYESDPKFVEAKEAAVESFAHPGAKGAQLMADPTYRANYEAAMEAFSRPMADLSSVIPPTAVIARRPSSGGEP